MKEGVSLKNIGIIGLGLMGGSIAKTLRNSEKVGKIIGFDNDKEILIKAFEDKVISGYTTKIDDKFSNLDIIFICTPVSTICNYIKELLVYIKEDCVITDIGSTKLNIVRAVEDMNTDMLFVGGHPMVGSEKMGYESSKNFLFENAYYIITKSAKTNQNTLNRVRDMILELKAIPIVIDVENHDFITAAISHVPHVIASSLVNMVASLDGNDEYMHKLAAGGFKDITRIASSSSIMWQNICIENKKEVLKVLDTLSDIINEFKENLLKDNSSEILDFFSKAKEYRDSFKNINEYWKSS